MDRWWCALGISLHLCVFQHSVWDWITCVIRSLHHVWRQSADIIIHALFKMAEKIFNGNAGVCVFCFFFLLQTLSCHAVGGKSCPRMLVMMMNWMLQLSIDCSFVQNMKAVQILWSLFTFTYYEACSHSHRRECTYVGLVNAAVEKKKWKFKIWHLKVNVQ